MDPRIAKIHYADYMKKCKEHREKRLKEAEEKRLESSRAYRHARNDISLMEREDLQLLSAYKALRKGHTILNINHVLAKSGLNKQKLPNLAAARAHHKWCHLDTVWAGAGRTVRFTSSNELRRPWKPSTHDIIVRPFVDRETAELIDTEWRKRNGYPSVEARAAVPTIPAHLRPADVEDGAYHILWEAVWEPVAPGDPILLKRVDKSDFFIVLAQWDLTPLEQQVLQGRFS
jgi:hypothetical protein